MRRRTLLGGGVAIGAAAVALPPLASPGHAAPIGSGWTEITPGYKLDQPPGRTRHSLGADGEHHFWIYDTDPSTYPGRDSGPRSELRFRNDYTSGQAQFEADLKVTAGSYRPCVMQIFGASTQATTFMALALDNRLNYYDSARVIHAPIYDTYLRLNVVHDTAARAVHVFVNRQFRATFADHGPGTHYFKCGLYGRSGMSARCDAYLNNIRLYRK